MTTATSITGAAIHFPHLQGADPAGSIPLADPAEIEAIARSVAPGELLLFARRLIDGSRKKARSPR